MNNKFQEIEKKTTRIWNWKIIKNSCTKEWCWGLKQNLGSLSLGMQNQIVFLTSTLKFKKYLDF